MTVWVYRNGKVVEKGDVSRGTSVQIMSDIKPYRNMINGKIITSRSEHRTLLRDHGCIEVGNDIPAVSQSAPPSRDQRRRRLHQQLDNMTDRQANKLLAEIRHQAHSRGR